MTFKNEAALGNERLRRCRNALVHGNPITTELVASVHDLSQRKANSASELPFRRVADDTSLGQLLVEHPRRSEEHTALIKAETSLLKKWTPQW